MRRRVPSSRCSKSTVSCRISLRCWVWTSSAPRTARPLPVPAGSSARFLSQPFHVAENFTGMQGKYVPLKETIKGFQAILGGDVDDLPEQAFLLTGTIDEVIAKRGSF